MSRIRLIYSDTASLFATNFLDFGLINQLSFNKTNFTSQKESFTKMLFRLFLTSLFLLSIFINLLSAQVSTDDNQACNPEFALTLVEQQVSESRTVSETDKRIKILLRVADFLWKFDEPAARKYFAEAFQTANERFKEMGFEKKSKNEKGFVFSSNNIDFRMEVIRAIAKKDGEWAKKLTEQILNDFEKNAVERDEFNKNRELNDLLNIATASAKTNPALSQYLFRRLMKYPLDSHWYWTLYAVARENKPLADSLYAELLQNYAMETPRRLLFLSAYPFARERIFGIDKFQFGTSVPENFTANPNLQLQFIEAFLRRTAIFADTPDDFNRPPDQYRLPEAVYLVTALRELEPVIIQNFPNLLQRLTVAKSQANALMSEENRKLMEGREKTQENIDSRFEARLEIARKAEAEGKLTDNHILSLVTGAKTESDFEQTEIWLEKIKSEKARSDLINYFYFLRSKLAVKEKRFEDARNFAAKVPEIEHRALLFFDIATEQLKNVNEASRVFDTLNEISKIARQGENSVEKAQVLLGLAAMYEKVNHTAALDELGEAIRVINQLENPDIFSTSVFRQIVGDSFAFFAVYGTPGYNMETAFDEIGKKDFELSLSHAKSFNDKYFRTLAVLAIAKNCIEVKPKKKTAKSK